MTKKNTSSSSGVGGKITSFGAGADWGMALAGFDMLGLLPACRSKLGASPSESDSLKSKTDVSDDDRWLGVVLGGKNAEVGGSAPTRGISPSAPGVVLLRLC